MKTYLASTLILLSALGASAEAGELPSGGGIIRFSGAVVKSPCQLPAATWISQAGRQNGISPAGAVPAVDATCAGIAETQSISATPVRDRQGVKRGWFISVTYL